MLVVIVLVVRKSLRAPDDIITLRMTSVNYSHLYPNTQKSNSHISLNNSRINLFLGLF